MTNLLFPDCQCCILPCVSCCLDAQPDESTDQEARLFSKHYHSHSTVLSAAVQGIFKHLFHIVCVGSLEKPEYGTWSDVEFAPVWSTTSGIFDTRTNNRSISTDSVSMDVQSTNSLSLSQCDSISNVSRMSSSIDSTFERPLSRSHSRTRGLTLLPPLFLPQYPLCGSLNKK